MRYKRTAVCFAFFLGWIGIHQFYLGRIWQGVFYLLMSWTFIPLFLSFIDFLLLLFMSNNKFNEKYNPHIGTFKSQYNRPQAKINTINENIRNQNSHSMSLNKSSNLNEPIYWSGGYVYSIKDLNKVSKAQQDFYYRFKKEFLNKNYIDIGNNRGYAFLLLFDLLNEYEQNRNYFLLLYNLEILSEKYSYSKRYVSNELAKLKAKDKSVITISDNVDVSINTDETFPQNNLNNSDSIHVNSNYQPQYEWDYDYWKLGKEYKEKFNLNKEEETILNRLYNVNNAFNDIEFLKEQNLKFFLLTINELEKKNQEKGQKLESIVEEITDLKVKKQYGYRKGSSNYKYTFDYEFDEVYRHIFRLNENYLREWFQHKRKLNTELNIDPAILEKYNQLIEFLPSIFDSNSSKIEKLPYNAELRLNTMNTTRWKFYFDVFIKDFTGDISSYKHKIDELANFNINNPSLENIYYEASKFIAKYDTLLSLEYYIKYIDADLKSSTVNSKKINQTVQKKLFKTKEQIIQFEKIVNEFIQDRDLQKALEQLHSIYQVKRKKIELNIDAIKEVKSQLSDTVVLLNEYLEDENEDVSIPNPQEETISLNLNQIIPNSVLIESNYRTELELNEIQIELLELFIKYDLNIHKDEVHEFVSRHNLFLESLIDSINEKCYELLDDTLIEEEDETFTIYQEYYKTISTK